MSAIANSPPPDNPPSAPPIDETSVPIPATRPPSPAQRNPATGPIRSDDTETPRFNPLTKPVRTYGKSTPRSRAPSIARSTAGSPTHSPDTSNVDLPVNPEAAEAPVNFTQDTSHREISAEPPFLPGPGPTLSDHPGYVHMPALTPSPAPELHVQPESVTVPASFAKSILDDALQFISVPRGDIEPRAAMAVASYFQDPISAISFSLSTRAKHGHPLSKDETSLLEALHTRAINFIQFLEYTMSYLDPRAPSPEPEPEPEPESGEDTLMDTNMTRPKDDVWESKESDAWGTWRSSPPMEAPNPTYSQRLGQDFGVGSDPSVESEHDLTMIESVRLMAFVANKTRISREEGKDLLAQFNPNVFGKWVKLTEEDLVAPPPSTRSNTPTPKAANGPPALAEDPDKTPTKKKKNKKAKLAPVTSLPVPTLPPSTAPKAPDAEATVENALAELAAKYAAQKNTKPAAPVKSSASQPPAPKTLPNNVQTPAGQPSQATPGKKSFADAAKPAATKTTQAPTPASNKSAAKPASPVKGPRYLVKFSPALPKDWFHHNQPQRVRERVKTYFQKVEKQHGRGTYPRCIAAGFTPAGHISLDFSPETQDADIVKWAAGLVRSIEAPNLGVLSRNTEWTKILISHVPTHFYVASTDVTAEEVSSPETLRLVMLDNIPQSFLDKYPMPVNPRWLKHPETLRRTGNRHDQVVLTVEDPEKTALEELQGLSVGFGMRNGPSWIQAFHEKPRMSICLRCCSYECPNPRNCRRPIRCTLCGDKHTAEQHNAKCKLCVDEGFTNVSDHRACTHPAKCHACKGNHEFGDQRCERRSGYRRGLDEILAEARLRNAAPTSEAGDDDGDDTMDDGTGFTGGRLGSDKAGLITRPSVSAEAATPGASSSNPIILDA